MGFHPCLIKKGGTLSSKRACSLKENNFADLRRTNLTTSIISIYSRPTEQKGATRLLWKWKPFDFKIVAELFVLQLSPSIQYC